VPEEFHNTGKADTVSEQLRRVGMTQAMWVDVLLDTGGLGDRLESVVEDVAVDQLSIAMAKEEIERLPGLGIRRRWTFSSLAANQPDQVRSPLVNRDLPLRSQLSERHPDRHHSVPVFCQAFEFQTTELANSQSCPPSEDESEADEVSVAPEFFHQSPIDLWCEWSREISLRWW